MVGRANGGTAGGVRIGPSMLAALRVVEARPGVTLLQLVDAIAAGVHVSAAYRTVKRCVSAGLLSEYRTRDGRRGWVLTGPGESILESVAPRGEQ